MDLKDFRDGLLSLSLFLFVLSLTFIVGSILMKPYIALEPQERDIITILMLINFPFCAFYGYQAKKIVKTFKLEDHKVIKWGKRMGIINLIYSPHLFVVISLFFLEMHNMQQMMIVIIAIIEALTIGLVFKEVYDLVFLEETLVKYDLEENRKRYLSSKRRPIAGIDY